MTRGYALSSQKIRDMIAEGRLITTLESPVYNSEDIRNQLSVEKRVQPSSFEPRLADTGFILDTEIEGLFRASNQDSVYRTLLRLPKRQRQAFYITNGFQLDVGYSYLIKLDEQVILNENERLKSSPKSSVGRDFVNSRLLADYHYEYDEATSKGNKKLDLWLLVQPLAFNVIVKSGLTLNQLRFFSGLNPQLSEEEVMALHRDSPLLLEYSKNKLVEKEIKFGQLPMTLNLEGKSTSGIVGLQARKNPIPIDLSLENGALSEDYFEPVVTKNREFAPVPGRYYLLSSNEVLNIPASANAELRAAHHTGLQGLIHFAGFIDNGFKGDLVLELRSDEKTPVILRHGTPVSILDIYGCGENSDKVYGKVSGAHYQGQKGPKVSKHLTVFDFARAGKEYKRLDELVLVEQKEKLLALRNTTLGFEFVDETKTQDLILNCGEGFYQSRYGCEEDDRVLQVVPYVLIFGPDNKIFEYTRAKKIQDTGDERLFSKTSIGVGGHIINTDKSILQGLKRKLHEEIEFSGNYTEPKLVGTLYQDDLNVDKVHFGLIYAIKVDNNNVKVKDDSIMSGNMRNIKELINDASFTKDNETWTQALIPYLDKIKENL